MIVKSLDAVSSKYRVKNLKNVPLTQGSSPAHLLDPIQKSTNPSAHNTKQSQNSVRNSMNINASQELGKVYKAAA
jgi:hypothetical protein